MVKRVVVYFGNRSIYLYEKHSASQHVNDTTEVTDSKPSPRYYYSTEAVIPIES